MKNIFSNPKELSLINRQLDNYTKYSQQNKYKIAQYVLQQMQELHNYIAKNSFSLSEKISQVVLLFGCTGVGKSTLLNHIANCPLKLKKQGLSNVLDIDASKFNKDTNIPAHIGHGKNSSTIIPNMRKIGDTLYVDLPGEGDNRGTLNLIANAAMRKQISNIAKNRLKLQ